MPSASRLALLVIDMQQGLFASEQSRYRSANVVANINLLIHHCHLQSRPVIFIQHDGGRDDPLEPHTPGWNLLPQLRRAAHDHVLRKTACDAFYRTGLAPLLHSLRVGTLMITGCATDFCVDTTLRAAASLDYQLLAISDAHTTANRPHLAAEQIIRHHNFMWQNLLIPTPIELIETKQMLERLQNDCAA
ncbi:cysteine hydrolase family protein [Pseudaeromonas sharmana]|uniref:Cysteine hydrolase family protein n=1 Tax=Pseudaeromonas sharmana TaxID=328412 RepID=A0ABV8CR57_9GAMM